MEFYSKIKGIYTVFSLKRLGGFFMWIGEKLNKLRNDIENSEGNRIQTKIRVFKISEYTFKKNYDELNQILTRFSTDWNYALEIMSTDNRDKFIEFGMEVTRLLHNYVASAKALVDHTRKFVQDEYEDTDFKTEYDEKIENEFANSQIAAFIQNLRNFCLHRTLPITGASMNFDHEKGMSNTVELLKADLMQWNNWRRLGNEFLDSKDDRFSLLEVVDEYFRKVEEFQGWFEIKQREVHKKELEELEKLQEECNSLLAQLTNR